LSLLEWNARGAFKKMLVVSASTALAKNTGKRKWKEPLQLL
jgi:hypothetical protein